MGLYEQIDKASFDQLIEWWNTNELPEWVDLRECVLDEIAYALSKSTEGVEFLRQYGRSRDVDKRRSAIWFLAHKDIVDEEILQYLLEAFCEDNDKLKNDALWGYIRLRHFPVPRSDIEQLVNGNDEHLSALATVYLSYAYPNETITILRQALSSPNPRQREYACDVIGDEDIQELMPEMVKLLDDKDEYVRQSAQANLRIWDNQELFR